MVNRVALGEIVEIFKGNKAPEVFDKPREDARRYLQIEDLRPDAMPKYAIDKDGTLATKNDVLIAWDGANAGTAGFDLEGYIGSTLAILRPTKGNVYAPYFGYFLRSKFNDIQKNTTGATIPHVSRDYLENLQIPLPPLSEQKRIASLLARADRLRGLRRAAREQCDSLLQSVFLEMFGDYLNKIECQFADVLQIPLTNGFFEKNEKYGTGNPIVWVDNLYHTNIIDISALRRVQVSEKELEKYGVFDGDLLFTRSSLVAEGVGQANIVPKLEERTMFESHIIRARVDKTKINPYYALGLFRSQFGKSEIMKRAKTATMTTIGQDALYEFPCPIPPLALQEEFARVVARVETLRARMDESARQGEALFQSLLAESFG
ncbi:MAG: restriction endonuclease subunit S [Anaerolineales bacterium]|jgi:type I restriction enzyme S subunit|nr:restriction endonuclease subunit S [Anaerolineales bacterium]MDX9937988.1 restriction endonuclease subunit S [Anaerolineales bacterium]WKZ55233.1 MAG: restriction endonuclease subunit S [Anaerolineales bacterium]GER81361.1 conserved hypothetical protein [Candidatus Denitrolinea symbiosum]